MPLSSITVNVGEGGLGRRPLNKDKISGILFYNNTLPSGFATDDREKKVLSLAEAEALGIIEGSVAHGVEWYHISEYFRLNPLGELWIGYYAVPVTTYNFTEIVTLGTAANGEIRQMAVYANALAFASTQIATLQGQADALDALGFYCSILYACNFNAVVLSTAANLRTETARKVSVCIGQDGGGAGAALYVAKSYSITAVGAMLGAVSRASVQQSIGNPAAFNISNGVELETVTFANGNAITDALLGALKDKGYTVIRKYLPKIAGSYFERVPTAIASTSDFSFIENNRVIDKAIRLAETILTPQLQSDLSLNTDGTLSDDVIGYFKDLVGGQLESMEAAGEISGSSVTIDPTQNILATSNLNVAISILPNATNEFITVNIGLTTEL